MVLETSAKLTQAVSERDHGQGPLDAPIIVVEYGDYECPHCRRVYPIIEALQDQLAGQMRYVFRHFPVQSVHPQAQLAAEAAEAAGVQGKFWEMHDLLFEQKDLSEAKLIDYARQLDLDVERFRADLTAHTYAGRVQADFLSGVHSGVNGIPCFFINGVRYDGPWDLESLEEVIRKPLGVQLQQLAQEFARVAAAGSVLLLFCALLALVWANSPWAASYFQLWNTELSFHLGSFSLSEHLAGWVNDGLMVIYFFVVGLEIKRELTVGELSQPKQAALPIIGALGGMLAPALIYLIFNAGQAGEHGWGIPMATDIAFTLGVMTILGHRVPLSLKVFFTTLAVADDLGSVLVIAVFYTDQIQWLSLVVAALFLIGLIGLNRARVYVPLPYVLLGIGLWLAFLESGVHPTIAGVLLATTIPTRRPPKLDILLAQCVTVLYDFDLPVDSAGQVESQRQAAAQTLETIAERLQSPAQKLEHELQPWTTYLVLPIFALANAGVSLLGDTPPNLFHPVALGIMLGLVVGKPLGITLISWLAVKTGVAEMPAGVDWVQFFSTSWLAGIGFTIALFIANASFADPALAATAKLAIPIASALAAILGWLLLLALSPRYERTAVVAE